MSPTSQPINDRLRDVGFVIHSLDKQTYGLCVWTVPHCIFNLGSSEVSLGGWFWLVVLWVTIKVESNNNVCTQWVEWCENLITLGRCLRRD